MLPTPRATDSKGSGPRGSKSQKHLEDRAYLSGTVATEDCGSLNPEFVENLMGYPVGFTNKDCQKSAREFLGELTDSSNSEIL